MTSRNDDDDRLLDHQYDGIQEYDNPMPRWWVWIFWATIVWGVLYFANVPGIGSGRGWIANYQAEVDAAARLAAETRGADTGPSAAALAALAGDPAVVEQGRAVFATQCAACHLADGGGLIGPNLADGYWIHGNQPLDVHRTIAGGVLDKGMPAWSEVLSADEVNAATAFVVSLAGSRPAQPKGPEGVNADSARAASPSTR
jgi:cytochrome c oxidase cbb3-type subunit 3